MSRTEPEDPYAAPSAEQRDTTVPRLAVRTLIAKVTLAGALGAAGAGLLIGLVGVIGGRPEDAFTSPEPSVYVVSFFLAVLARALTIPVCGIALLAWVHRAVRRVLILEPGATVSPGWAVAWWFIPLVSLWKPLGVMRDLWSASHGQSGSRTPVWLGVWWATWIVLLLISNVGFSDGESVTRADEHWMLVLDVASLVLGLLSWKIVAGVARAQADRLGAP